MEKLVAVVIDLPKKSGKQILHYLIPPSLVTKAKIGCRVLVPLGNSVRDGYIIYFPEKPEVEKLKPIKEIIDEAPIISQEMVDVAMWVSKRYLCPLHKVIDYIIPPNLRFNKEKWVKICEDNDLITSLRALDPDIDEIYKYLYKGPKKLKSVLKNISKVKEEKLHDLEKRGLIEIYTDFTSKETTKEIQILKLNLTSEELFNIEDNLKRAPKQLAVIKYLKEKGDSEVGRIVKDLKITKSVVDALENKGLIIKVKEKVEREPIIYNDFVNKDKILLNEYQQNAVNLICEKLDKDEYGSFLLHGVTGSGKTEVYLRCIDYALKQGKGALVLVPEISLTPQTIGRFKSVLGKEVVVLHSALSKGERQDAFEALRLGKAKVAVGVRSAVFAPVQNLGIIVIDEEHESTFKQSEPDPRYHARDVALKRIMNVKGVLLLGSATPAIETYYHAKQNIFTLLELPKRVKNHPFPEVEVVDLTEELRLGNKSIFSTKLRNSIIETLEKDEQIILFLNRRGYSTFVLCRECGEPLLCKNCSITLTYHSATNEMKCHYCNYKEPVPKICPHCGSKYIRYFGSGTQQVEDELLKNFPGIKVTRMDVDTTTRKNSHQELLAEFSQKKTQVLLGTQMIAKGLDFPNVTLVGVIAADTSLNLPDYKASEKTFQLLTQVAGRTGRGEKKGKVIVQTYNPEHYSILTAKEHDYKAFYEREIVERKSLDYPPFSYLVRIIVNGLDEADVSNLAEIMTKDLRYSCKDNYEIFGPSAAPLAKIQRRFRWQIILKGNNLNILRKSAWWVYKKYGNMKEYKQLRIIIDIEPQSIL